MITLYQFAPGFDKPFSVSPFCAKLEAYLRLAGLEYKTVNLGDPRKAPKGKLPFVDIDGDLMGDSTAIIATCKDRFGDPLDGDLTAEQHHRGLLVQRTCEEHLYWSMIQSRFVDDRGWQLQKGVVGDTLPAPLRLFVPGLVRRGIGKALQAHGIGRHGQDEIYSAGVADLEACQAQLDGKAFLLGDTPTSYDCSLWRHASCALSTKSSNALTDGARTLTELGAYVERMTDRLGFA